MSKREVNREFASVPAFPDDGGSPVDFDQIVKEAQDTAVQIGVGAKTNSIEFMDPENTAKALTMFAQGAAYRKVEAETGLSRHTLIRLKYDHTANIEKMKPYFARRFAIMADLGMDLLQEKFDRLYEDPSRLDEISPDRLAVTVGVMTDKAAQLAGMASVTIEHRKGASIEEALEFQKAVRERIKATQTVIEAEVC